MFMNQENIKWIRETIESIRVSIIGRFETGTMRKKDQLTLTEMLANIQDTIAEEAVGNESVEALKQELAKLQDSLTGHLKDNIEDVKAATDSVERKLEELEKVNHIANALQLDAQSIIPLMEQLKQKQEEVRQSFQHAVDLDFKLYGEVSSLTAQAMDTFHFTVSEERQVIAVAPAMVEQKELIQPEPEQKQNPEEARTDEKLPGEGLPEQSETWEYLHILPMGKNQFKETVDFLKKNGARFDGSDWYMRKGSISWSELEAHHVEPIQGQREYLKIPKCGKEQFGKIVTFMKENGAHFDKKIKKWYVFPGKDGDKVKEYLNQRESVLGKLQRNKDAGEKAFSRDNPKELGKEKIQEEQR